MLYNSNIGTVRLGLLCYVVLSSADRSTAYSVILFISKMRHKTKTNKQEMN